MADEGLVENIRLQFKNINSTSDRKQYKFKR